MCKGKHQKGFTLIELVVVIAVLAILAGVAVPRFLSITSQASEAAEKADVGAIRSGILTTAIQAQSTSGGKLAFPDSLTVSDTGKNAFQTVLEDTAALDLYERGWRETAKNTFTGPAKNTYKYTPGEAGTVANAGTFLKQ